MSTEELTTTELVARYDELSLAGEAPAPEEFARNYPAHPTLLTRLQDLAQLKRSLERLLDPEPPALAPPVIPGLRLIRCLAQGGMGSVWIAMQEHPRRLCAVKLMRQPSASAQRRFRREADLAGKLSHPGIAAVYASDTVAGQPYLVTEYVHGYPLRSLLRVADLLAPAAPGAWLAEALRCLAEGEAQAHKSEAKAPVIVMVEIAKQVACALAYAHEHGVVHRDVKPANVMITFEGTAKLIDFGIAVATDDFDARLTHAGAFVGSLAYAAPEQLRGEPENIGPWTDTYSLGATLFEMLTQQSAFGDSSFAERLKSADVPLRAGPRAKNPDVPPALDALVLRALSPMPKDRFQDGDELARALAQVLTETSPLARLEWLSPTWFRPALSLMRRRVVTLLLLLALVGTGGLYLHEHYDALRTREELQSAASASHEAVLDWCLERARPQLDACVPYRPVPMDVPVMAVRLVVDRERVVGTEMLPSSRHLTRAAERCLAGVLTGLELPGVGLDAPEELRAVHRVDVSEGP